MEELMQRARAYACAKGYSNEADDFAQEAAIQLQGGRKATIAQLWIDFLRVNYGRVKAGKASKYSSYVEKRAWREPVPEDSICTPNPIENASWRELLSKAEGSERQILVLYFEWGLELKEIGHVLGVSESRVCQMLNRVKAKLKVKLKYLPGYERGTSL